MKNTTSLRAACTLAALALLSAGPRAAAVTPPSAASAAPASSSAAAATATAAASAPKPAPRAEPERRLEPPREPTPAAVRRAKEFYNLAFAFVQKGDLEGALRAFQASYEQDGGAEALANIAVVEKALGRPRSAAEHLDAALTKLPPSQAGKSDDLKLRLTEMRQEIGTLDLKITASGSEVYVDEEWLSSAPVSRTVYLDPGEHNVRVQAAGAIVRRRVTARKGVTETIAIGDAEVLAARPPAAPVTTAAASAPADDRSVDVRDWIAAGLGVTFLATGAIGVGVYLRAHDERAKIESDIQRVGGYCGPTPALGFKDDCHARDQEAANETVGTVLGLTGGIGVGGLVLGGLMVLLTRPSPAPAKSLAVRVVPTFGGVQVEGRF